MENADWNKANMANNIPFYAYYIGENPKSKYVDDAIQKVNDILLSNLDNIYSVTEYIQYFPDGEYIDLAIDTLDDLKLAELLESGESADISYETGDIITLLSQNKIAAKINGGGLEHTWVSLTNLTNTPLMVVLPLGTWFESESDEYQNTLLTREVKFYIFANGTRKRLVDAAGMNINRGISYSGDSLYTVNYLGDDELLTKVIKAMQQESSPLIQAAVWRITDDADDDDLINALGVGPEGFGTTLITTAHIAKADKIIESLK